MTLDELRGRVLETAYLWRYAIVTPGADVDAAEQALVAAVDALDEEQTVVADELDKPFELCDHPRLVSRLPCPACAPRYERRAAELKAQHGWKAARG